MKTWHIVILIGVVLGLTLAAPVSAAYSISVFNGFGEYTPKFHSHVSGITVKKPQVSIDTNSFGSSPGSVSAFSNGILQDQTKYIEFKQKVTVDGIINGFSYSAKYDSGVFR